MTVLFPADPTRTITRPRHRRAPCFLPAQRYSLSPPRAKSVARATVNASRVFNFGAEIGTLKPGAEADVSVLDLKGREFTFTDSAGKTRNGRQKLEAVTTVKGGKVFEAMA